MRTERIGLIHNSSVDCMIAAAVCAKRLCTGQPQGTLDENVTACIGEVRTYLLSPTLDKMGTPGAVPVDDGKYLHAMRSYRHVDTQQDGI